MAGCGECGGKGHHEITGCPLAIVSEDVWTLHRLVRFMDEGLPPVAGGVLDQAEVFLDAMTFVRAEKHRIEADRERRRSQGAR